MCPVVCLRLNAVPAGAQGSSQRQQSATQAPGPAGHGAAAQAVALQAQRQPVPDQDGENPAGARLADDSGPGETLSSALIPGGDKEKSHRQESDQAAGV